MCTPISIGRSASSTIASRRTWKRSQKTSRRPHPPTAEAIEHRIRTISLDKEGCDAWLANQFGKPDAKAAVKPQKPYPMRVVWAKDGPIDDPTMYIRGGGESLRPGIAA